MRGNMNLPAAIAFSVLIWSSAKYIPPYYLEMRRMDVEQEKIVVEHNEINMMMQQLQAASQRRDAQRASTKSEMRLY